MVSGISWVNILPYSFWARSRMRVSLAVADAFLAAAAALVATARSFGLLETQVRPRSVNPAVGAMRQIGKEGSACLDSGVFRSQPGIDMDGADLGKASGERLVFRGEQGKIFFRRNFAEKIPLMPGERETAGGKTVGFRHGQPPSRILSSSFSSLFSSIFAKPWRHI